MTTSLPCTWGITDLHRIVNDGFVYEADYSVTAELNGRRSTSPFSITFKRPDDLIPYEDLTEAIVISWVKEALGADGVAGVEKFASQPLLEPEVSEGLPWPIPGYDPNFNPPEDT